MSASPDCLRQNRATELISVGTEKKMTFRDRLYPPPGLRVLVTAGASGIGAVIASAFAETGASIHICDIDDAALAAFRKSFPSCKTTTADVADEEQVAAMFVMQREQFDGLDVLVNCAGIAGPTAGIDRIQEKDWSRTIDVNLNGQYRCLHHAVPMLRESRFANVICISSVAGRLGYPWRTPYAATKWAIVGIVKSLAIELGSDNIRVNAVLPGLVEGPRIDGVISARARLEGVDEVAMREEYLNKISLHRMVTPDDVALTCLFLCSPAGQNISGQAISVDGNVEYL
jgi:NAD(P)-dependent dehydrogenase (short-subunit alcohol dehydrogenase family)